MFNDFITLVAKTYEKDARGVQRKTEVLKENIPALVRSAGSQEYFEGGRNGLNPQYQFTIRTLDYAGEETVIYEEKRYAIYRTYRKDADFIELHVQKESGA